MVIHFEEIHQATPELNLLEHQKADKTRDDHALRGVKLSKQRETS